MTNFRENYDNIGEDYTNAQLEFYKLYPDVTRILTYCLFTKAVDELVAEQEEITVLDPCCGFAKDVRWFRDYLETTYPDVNSTVISGDSSQCMLQIAKDRFDVETSLHRPYEDTGLADESVDLVATRYGLDYPLDPSLLAAELYRVLKPGGAVIGIVNHQSLMDQLLVVKTYQGIDLLELPAFNGKVPLTKPRLDQKDHLNTFLELGFQLEFQYAGIEHPEKFLIDNKTSETKEYLAFMLRKMPHVFTTNYELPSLLRGISALESKFKLDPESDFGKFVSKEDMLSLEDFDRIVGNIHIGDLE